MIPERIDFLYFYSRFATENQKGRSLMKTTFKRFLNVSLGNYTSKQELIQALESEGYLTRDSRSMLERGPNFTLSPKKTVSLVKMKVHELGFQVGTRLCTLRERAREYGLMTCDMEVPPVARIIWNGQKQGELVKVMTEPVCATRAIRYAKLFTLGVRRGKLILGSTSGFPQELMQAGDTVVFQAKDE